MQNFVNLSNFALVNKKNDTIQNQEIFSKICTFNTLGNKTSGRRSCSRTVVWACCSCYNGEYVIEIFFTNTLLLCHSAINFL